MKERIKRQFVELTEIHGGLNKVTELDYEIIIAGILPFEASTDGFDMIRDSFEVELRIPHDFPDMLPNVKEIAGKIERTYPHINQDGTLCLAIPIEQRRVFFEQPSLLGFVNRLLIPYLFGYCHWKRYGRHPFDEQAHGAEGIVQYYIETLQLADEIAALAVVCFLLEHGYRGHHLCPCGSTLKVRNCHGPALRRLHQYHTSLTLKHDLESALDVCVRKHKAGQLPFPISLKTQIRRLLGKGVVK